MTAYNPYFSIQILFYNKKLRDVQQRRRVTTYFEINYSIYTSFQSFQHMHTFIPAYLHILILVVLHTNRNPHTYINANLNTCIPAYCILGYLHYLYTWILYILAYLHICIFAYFHVHTCIPECLHTCILAYLHTCIHAYLHTCIIVYYLALDMS